jgi:hypothetical protein
MTLPVPAPAAVLITVLAAWLGAHFAVLLLGGAAVVMLIALGVLTERITHVVIHAGWRTIPGVAVR